MLDPDPETRLTFAQVLDVRQLSVLTLFLERDIFSSDLNLLQLDVFKKFKKPVFSRVHKKMVRSPELDEAATKQKGKKRKSKGELTLVAYFNYQC